MQYNNKLTNFENEKIVEQEIQKYKQIKKYLANSIKTISNGNIYKNSVQKRFQLNRKKDIKKLIKRYHLKSIEVVPDSSLEGEELVVR